jgi:hypothetical protein
MVASPLLCALRRWRGAAGVVCGGGRRHGGRLDFGWIVQLVRDLEVLDAIFSFCACSLLVSSPPRRVSIATFRSLHP